MVAQVNVHDNTISSSTLQQGNNNTLQQGSRSGYQRMHYNQPTLRAGIQRDNQPSQITAIDAAPAITDTVLAANFGVKRSRPKLKKNKRAA
jgi:hypothetical protein